MKHPVTQVLLSKLNFLRQENAEALEGFVMNNDPLQVSNKGMPYLLQLKGELTVLDLVIGLKEFMSDQVEEIKTDEIPSTGKQSFN